MTYKRKTSPSMKPRDIRRRLDRSFQKIVQRDAQLQLLYKNECIRNKSAAIEGVLHAAFMHGFLFGGHHAVQLHEDMYGRR